MKISRKISSFVVAGALLAALPISTLANEPEKKVIDYVALGDSLAVGVTPYNQVDLGYADYLSSRFEQTQYTVDFNKVAAPGFTSEQLKQAVLTATVQEKIRDAEYITIDIGANDLLRVLGTPALIPATIHNMAMNLQVILGTIDQLNPDANVYVMGYYNPFPYAPEEQQPQLLQLLNLLNQTIQAAAIANGNEYVAMDEIIAKDYETYLPNPNNIHLSQEGYQIVAQEFWKNIDKSKND